MIGTAGGTFVVYNGYDFSKASSPYSFILAKSLHTFFSIISTQQGTLEVMLGRMVVKTKIGGWF